MKDDDFNKIDYISVYMQCYKVYGVFYSLKDVQGITLINYGSIYPPEKVNIAKTKRVEQLEKVLCSYSEDVRDALRKLNMTNEFLKNGNKGITVLKQNFQKYPEFLEVIRQYSHLVPHNELFQQFVNVTVHQFKVNIEYEMATKRRRSEIIDEIGTQYIHLSCVQLSIDGYIDKDSVIMAINDRKQREIRLRKSLAFHNLHIRSDSLICKDFVDRNKGTLEETVRIMREMNFFFTFTNYKNIMRNLMRLEYEYQRETNYEDIIDRTEISKQAKRQALKYYRGNVPDFIMNL